MHFWYNLLLVVVTIAGGGIALRMKWANEGRIQGLLAFSGSFLLGITFLHLLPEAFEQLHWKAGLYLLIGFFVQLLIQRLTHGMEHGHVHAHDHNMALFPVLAGLSIHAFMEGLPLGFEYSMAAASPSLYLAVGIHKLPEVMLATSLVAAVRGQKTAWIVLVGFSLITPLGAVVAQAAEARYVSVSPFAAVLLPVVAGAFIHIATTIFFESGTRQHMLTLRKAAAMLSGVCMALLTMVLE
jgi:zinc and cadmium transporter